VATEQPSEIEQQGVTREAFIEDVIQSIKQPPKGMTADEVRDRLLADMLYHLMSAEALVSQVTGAIQKGGIGSLLGGLLGKGSK
jgi:hypothetical protein